MTHPEPTGPDTHRLDATGAADPHAVNRELRERGAAVPVVLPGDVDGFVVLGHEELKDFLTHPDVAKDACHFAALQRGQVPEGWPLLTFATVQGMTTADGDAHRRLRGLVSQAFTVRRVEGLRPRVAKLTGQLLDQLAAAADGAADGVADLRRHFAFPLPMSVISELLGIDPMHADRLHVLSNRIVSTDTTPADAVAANREMIAILAHIAATRRESPGDDLTSALIAARAEGAAGEEDGGRLSEQELIGTLLLMIVAGHETTLNLITNAVRALCAHRGQLDLVRAGKAGWDAVVEETLRYDSPVSYFPFHYPVRDLDVGGTVIPKGTPVLAGYSGAGRDPRTHGDDADRFDITRPPARHLSLGHGPHFCLGAPLARLEATVALEALFTRFPDLDVTTPDDALRRVAGFVGNSVRELPVRLAPERR